MLRVLQVVTHLNRGGLETMLMNYYRNIDRTQVQFDFLTHRPYDGDYGEEIQQMGGTIYHLPVLNPFSFSYKKELGDFFDNHPEYQIIHVHQDCLSSVILKIAKKHGIKVRIAHSHNASQDKDLKYPIKMFYRRFISKYATELMACSQSAGNWMFCGASFRILNNAICTADYRYDYEKRQRIRTEFSLNKNELIVGHVGRFSPQKNHEFLIDIFYQVKVQYPNSKLLLVGDDRGELADKIKCKVAELNLKDAIIFAGLHSDVADLMQAMDVFVFPSKYEGFGIAIIEAQSAGLPCVISDTIPSECIKTELVQQINLASSANEWARIVVKKGKETARRDTTELIKKAGFDIAENAKWLQQYYLEKTDELTGKNNKSLL